MSAKNGELTARQAAFVDEYVKSGNGRQAAIAAGYSPKNAEVEAARLLTNAKVRTLIEEKRAQRSKQTGIDAAWLLKRLAEEAEADLKDLYEDEGLMVLKPIDKWPLVWRQGLVAGVKHGRYGLELKVSDRARRLELIGKHIGVSAFQENVKVSGLGDLAARLDRATRNAEADGDGE
jgi:phage terminase small subunit